MKEYTAFPKTPALLEPNHQIVYSHKQDTLGRVSYPSAEMQSVYSTVPADWERFLVGFYTISTLVG